MASDDRAPLTFACPSCGAEAALDVLLAHDESARLVAWVIDRHAPLGALVTRYLRLFKPAKQRLRPGRVRALLEALVTDMQRGAVARKGRDWPAPTAAWKAGLESVLDNHAKGALDLPLHDHAYLHEVLLRMADKVEADAERQRDAERRGRAHEGGMQALGEAIAPRETPPAPATPIDYSKPSRHALRLREEIALRKAARAGGPETTKGGDA